MWPTLVDVEQRLAEVRADHDAYFRLLADEELFLPLHRDDADAIVDEGTTNFRNVYFDDEGQEYLQVYTRGALRDLGDEIVFVSGSFDWAVGGLEDKEYVIINRGTHAELRLTGADIWPWLDANEGSIPAVSERENVLITAPYGQLDGSLAHALACGAHLAVFNAVPWNVLSRVHYDYLAEVRGLREWWDVRTPADWRSTMDSLIGNDYALTPGNLVLLLRLEYAARNHVRDAEMDPLTWRDAITEWGEENEATAEQIQELRDVVGKVLRYEERFRADGLLAEDEFVTTAFAWDLGRAVNMAKWGLVAGHCDYLTAELMVMEASAITRKYHQSWKDFSVGYIMGRVLHFDEETFGDWYQTALGVHRLLMSDPASPWLNIDFDPEPAPGNQE